MYHRVPPAHTLSTKAQAQWQSDDKMVDDKDPDSEATVTLVEVTSGTTAGVDNSKLTAKQRLRCRILHAALVLIHAFLFVVYSQAWEQGLNVTITTSNAIKLPTIVTVISQVFGTVRIYVLVLFGCT